MTHNPSRTPVALDGEDDLAVTPATVLVADDDEAMRSVLTAALAMAGYRVKEAGSGSDLRRAVGQAGNGDRPTDRVDLVVVDMRMPGPSGLELIRELKAARCTTPTILMTAFAAAEVVDEAASLGVPVLSKPFALEALTRTAASLLGRGGAAGPAPCRGARPAP